jgi:hypothetical protein
MDSTDLDNRFEYHAPDDEKRQLHEGTRTACRALAEQLNGNLPEGREKSLAITKLEEVMFWSNAAIARNGVESRA